MDQKRFLYEARPYIYGVIGFYALVISRQGTVMIISGVLMSLCCLFISSMRYQYRKSALPSQKASSKASNQDIPMKSYNGTSTYYLK